MAGYDVFARYYDALTANVDYKGRAAYLKKLLEHLHHEPGIVLDLACGTGSLTLELYKLGMDVYGVDGSIAMLSEAKDKAYDMEADVMFLCQKMQTLDLFGTVNTVFCSLDSINHLSGEAQVQAAFDRVAFFMDNDSWFIFDVNTLYKHEKVLGNNTYIYDLADIYCAWQNRYNPQDHSVAISLDFFEKEGKVYTRSSEHFFEHAYSVEKLTEMLKKSGFDRVEVFGDLSFDAPKPEEQRIIFAAHITNSQNGVLRTILLRKTLRKEEFHWIGLFAASHRTAHLWPPQSIQAIRYIPRRGCTASAPRLPLRLEDCLPRRPSWALCKSKSMLRSRCA